MQEEVDRKAGVGETSEDHEKEHRKTKEAPSSSGFPNCLPLPTEAQKGVKAVGCCYGLWQVLLLHPMMGEGQDHREWKNSVQLSPV
jgi:hypothetical protein